MYLEKIGGAKFLVRNDERLHSAFLCVERKLKKTSVCGAIRDISQMVGNHMQPHLFGRSSVVCQEQLLVVIGIGGDLSKAGESKNGKREK